MWKAGPGLYANAELMLCRYCGPACAAMCQVDHDMLSSIMPSCPFSSAVQLQQAGHVHCAVVQAHVRTDHARLIMPCRVHMKLVARSRSERVAILDDGWWANTAMTM